MKTLFTTKSTKYKVQGTKAVLITAFCCLPLIGFTQETTKDTTKVNQLEEVTVSAVRAKGKNPVTFTNYTKKEMVPRNLGQDIPILLNYLPSVVTTTDAGNGVGYTYMLCS